MNEARVAVADGLAFRWQTLAWATTRQAHDDGFVLFLTNNGIDYPSDPFPNRLFVGAKRVISLSEPDAFQSLYKAHLENPSYLAGYFGYDLKNQLENLTSRHPNRLGFPDACFVEPEWVIDFDGHEIIVRGEGDVDALMEEVKAFCAFPLPQRQTAGKGKLPIQCRVTPAEYMDNVRTIQQHILAGDVYELNYCIEFLVEAADLDPLETYRALNDRSPMPFSSFMKVNNRYVVGASPERFLRKQGQQILSQPIKGTIRRGHTPIEDEQLRLQLLHSEKERAENLMIVDLVRNDLARSAETGSVQVNELFGIYGFEHVFQMISTVSATLRNEISWAEGLRNAFPMGSMTGAPKIRAMELIDQLEVSRRGIYSGALGFITPKGDFDFSVVIRSLLYDAPGRYASFSVGSAITYEADPAQEWEECLLKARAIREVLEG
ncbi:anthranilate synthase component I family protein [Spirosoma utsteinense]|uniref:Para-aminobenzoate synthetase component 1 n=1 Tax=Spirosoma utsteinense TaxID=2585773 RepID=A0ABR6W159_9BACT|nr:anthranilate synthase component I family protein [Spirosoma utsteinense]MBC3786867.1 para-aminobenzoate synthetase component 1 [Spirosoma utsteinense]MBC3789836.1 para-aminobenzoate synthetase component 1 [Spirosoma utsteinense]